MLVICSLCGTRQELTPRDWRCSCGGAWETLERSDFNAGRIEQRDYSIWRYKRLYALDFSEPACRLGAGWTPLLETTLMGQQLYLKLEHLAPTGSFKDRGTELMMNILARQGVTRVIDDSSGNAGASVAAYAAAAGMHADIYVPDYASESKQAQIGVYGAAVHPVPGARIDAKHAAIEAAQEGAVYGSHAYHPGFLLGQQSLAWELWEQLGQRAPDWYVVPLGQGVQLLGVWLGFRRLLAARLIDRLPRMVGVQPERCAPVAKALAAGAQSVAPVQVSQPSLAEGVMISEPVRGRRLLQAIRETGGSCIAVGEDAISQAQATLAHRGLYIEPTSAVVIAALDEVLRFAEPGDVIVLPLTGSGLKGSPAIS